MGISRALSVPERHVGIDYGIGNRRFLLRLSSGPDSTGGIYRIAFPKADETTKGYTNKFGPEPRYHVAMDNALARHDFGQIRC